MATIKLITRASSKSGALPVYYLRIIHRCRCKTLSTRVVADGTEIALEKAEFIVNSYRRAIEALDMRGWLYTTDDIIALGSAPKSPVDIISYVLDHVRELKESNRNSTAKIFKKLANNLAAFLGERKWILHQTSRPMILHFAQFLGRRGIKRNTLAAYMRPLRKILRMAHKEGWLQLDSGCFKDIPLGTYATEKRAVSRYDLQRIAKLNLDGKPKLQLCRDLFLFSFYAMGMPFVDMAYLTHDNLRTDCITYRRRKTGQIITVPLNDALREIISRYANHKRNRLFPAMGGTTSITYDSALRMHNKRLKEIGRLANLTVPLTSYVTRHTWATLAREINVAIAIISAALGHTSERTTSIYLDSISNPILAEANHRIADLILNNQ